MLLTALLTLPWKHAGIGILTPRGTGTSGYVQTNKFNLRGPPPQRQDRDDDRGPVQRKANQDILEHNRKREIELEVEVMRAQLEDDGCVTQGLKGFWAAGRAATGYGLGCMQAACSQTLHIGLEQQQGSVAALAFTSLTGAVKGTSCPAGCQAES